MRSERLRWLVAAEGPFASVYFDDPHDTLDAVERREATWRDVRKHLESRDAKQELIDSLEEAVRDSRPAVGQRGRALIATGEQVLVNEHLIGPPPATVIRLSDYPYVVPLIDLEMRRPTYVFAAVDHTGADVKLYQGPPSVPRKSMGSATRCTSRSPPAGTATATSSTPPKKPSE